jgi:hypothetical protein
MALAMEMWQYTGPTTGNTLQGTIVVLGAGAFRPMGSTNEVNTWLGILGITTAGIRPCGDINHWNSMYNVSLSGFIAAGQIAAR